MVFVGLIFNVKIPVQQLKPSYTPLHNAQELLVNKREDVLDFQVEKGQIHYKGSEEFEFAKYQGLPVKTDENGSEYIITSENDIAPPQTIFTKYVKPLYHIWGIIGFSFYIWFVVSTVKLNESLTKSDLYKENIYFEKGIPSPFTFGFIKPNIFIPIELKNESIDSIILHEQYHIKRKDHIIKPLCLFITVLHFFNPFVWIAYKLMCEDMEMSCDEAIIEKTSNKKDYSKLILDCATTNYKTSPSSVFFGNSDAEKRIKNILNYKKSTKLMAVLLSAIIVFCFASTFCSAKIDEQVIKISFSDKLSQVANIDNVEYKYRKTVYGLELKDIDGNPSPDGFISPVGQDAADFRGLRIDDHPDGMFYYTIYSEPYVSYDNTPILNGSIITHRFLNKDSHGFSAGSPIDPGYIEKIVDQDFLGKYISYKSYYSRNISQKNNSNLIIQKSYTQPKTKIEKFLDELNLFIDYYDDNKYLEKYYSIPDERVGKDVKGVRFVNEDLGFIIHAKDGYTTAPQALITVDGCENWFDVDFSQLTLPEKFIGYRSSYIDIYGERIEIRLDCQYTNGEYSNENEWPYYLISNDCGKTWSGYIASKDLQTNKVILEKATEELLCCIK